MIVIYSVCYTILKIFNFTAMFSKKKQEDVEKAEEAKPVAAIITKK